MKLTTASAVVCVCVLGSAVGCSRPAPRTNQRGTAAAAGDSPAPPAADDVQIEMRNVRLHAAGGVVLDIRRLRGRMVARVRGRPPVFDDQRSYVLHLADADLSMDMASITSLMNDHVFAGEDAPMTHLRVSEAGDGRLRITGRLRKGIPIPFSTKVGVEPAAGGRLRMRAESFRALGVPAKGAMRVFGLELDDLVDPGNGGEVTVEDNDLLLSPGRALPPPEIRGHIARATVTGNRLHLVYEPERGQRPSRLSPPDPRAPNYIYFSGGVITFGKLTMADADLQLIDLDRKDVFDFYPARYSRQLIAGYSKNTPRQGLETYMPDYDDLSRPAPQ
jgi:hypothetical protein